MISRVRSFLSALIALGALVVLVAGLPIVLYRFGGPPLPGEVPGWAHFAKVLTSRDDGTVLLGIIRTCSWLAWLLFTACVLTEAQAAFRGRQAPHLRLGGLQGAAAHLVALSALAFTVPPVITLTASVALASQAAHPGARQRAVTDQPPSVRISKELMAVDQASRQSSTPPRAGYLTAIGPSAAVEEAHPATATRLVTVRPGDCLWSLAHRYLGAGNRYPEIVRLNYGHEMVDGQVFRSPSLIDPGWQLLIPIRAIAGPNQHGKVGHHLGHPTKDEHYRRRHPAAAKPRVSLEPNQAQGNSVAAVSPSTAARAATTSRATDGGAALVRNTPGKARHETPTSIELQDSALPSAAAFVTGTVAGAVLARLAQLRRIQRQHRRRGRRIPLPAEQEVLEAEQRLRAIVPTEHLETLHDALTCLETSILGSGQDLPDIVGLHVTPDVLEVLLAVPASEAPPAPFKISPGRQGMCWQLDLPAIVSAPAANGSVRPFSRHACHLLPALITAGATAGGYLLLDLESMRVAGCDGPPGLVDRFISTIATELAVGHWSGWYDLILVGFGELASLGGAEYCPALDEALDLLTLRESTVARRIAERAPADVRELRLAEPDDEDWGLTVMVSRAEPSAEQMSRLLKLAEDGRGGIAALVAGDPESDDGRMAPTVMQLAPDPELPDGIIANVVPLQITVRPRALSDAEYEAIRRLLSTAAGTEDVGQEDEPYVAYAGPPWIPQATGLGPWAGADMEERTAVDSAGAAAVVDGDWGARADHWTTGQTQGPAHNGVFAEDEATRHLMPPAPTASPSVKIRMLGPFAVASAAGQLQPKQAELVLALALAAPAGLSNSALCSMLGADADHPKPPDAVRQLISRTRRRLGLACDGRQYVIHAGNGQYVLHPEAALDWSRFRALVKTGHADDLRQALSLVAGQPFTGSYFWWIDIPLLETVRAEIVDTAETLAEFELTIDSPRAAAKAARAGLMAEPSAEQLWRVVMRAEHAAGNLAGVAEAWRRCLAAIEDVAPDGEPHPDTAMLYQQLTRSTHQRVEVP